MEKLLLVSLCCVGLLGCSGGKDDVELVKYVSPLRNVPIPLDADETPQETYEEALNPILKDSIMTLEEQQELIDLVKKLLDELAFYQRAYYLQKLK